MMQDHSSFSLELEVITVEGIHIRISHPVLVDVLLEVGLLLLENRHILTSDSFGFSSDTVTKSEIFNVGLLSFNLDLSVIHFFLESIQLPLKVLFRLHSHANLGELKDKFEEGEERDHVSSGIRTSDSNQEITFLFV